MLPRPLQLAHRAYTRFLTPRPAAGSRHSKENAGAPGQGGDIGRAVLAGAVAVAGAVLGHQLRRVGRTLSQKQGEGGEGLAASLASPLCVWGGSLWLRAWGCWPKRGWTQGRRGALGMGRPSRDPAGLPSPPPLSRLPCYPRAEELDRAQGQLQSTSSRLSEAMEELESTR